MRLWIWLLVSATAVRLLRSPVALVAGPDDPAPAAPAAPAEKECPPVKVDYDYSSVSVPAPTFVTQLYESVGHCDDTSPEAAEPFRFRAIIRDGDEWRGILPLPASEKTSHLCAVGVGCIGNYDGVPAEPERAAGEWVPLRVVWPLKVLHTVMIVFAILALVTTAILAWAVPSAFNWFPADKIHDPPVELPPDYELLGEVAMSLAKMFLSTATLWMLLFFFVVRRSVTPWVAVVLLVLPMVLMFVHTGVVLWSVFRKSLYYALFAQGIHLNFPDRKILFEYWIFVAVSIGLFLYCVGQALWEETADAQSIPERVVFLFAKMWAVLMPLGYCMFLLYSDDQFVWKLRPLHALFARHEGMAFGQASLSGKELGETTQFIHNLRPIDEDHFLACGKKLAEGAGGSSSNTTLVDAQAIIAMDKPDPLPELTPWEKLQTLRWTIPISFSTNILRFRLILVAVLFAGTALILMLAGMLSHYMQQYPTIARVELTHGFLQPPFDPHIFHYTIMVDKHVKGEQLDIIPDQDITTNFHVFDNRAMDVNANATTPGGIAQVYMPYYRHPDKNADDDAEGDDFLAAEEHPVTFYIEAMGAGTRSKYTFTVVKTLTVVTDLTYTYFASGENVTVTRELADAKLMSEAEESGERIDDDSVLEVYVPPTTEEVEIGISKEMVIYGPKKRRVDPAEFGWLDAGADVHLCPPQQDRCSIDKSDRMKMDALDSGVVAVPVVLSAKGGSTRTFTVALVRVHNRLTNVKAATFSPGREWAPTVLTPPFDPLHLFYQAFFEPPVDGAGDMFLKLEPAGDPGVNRLLLDLEAPDGVTLVPFCRHPEEFLIAEQDNDLDCSTDPHALRTQYGNEEYRGQLLIRVESRKQRLLDPFEARLTVVAEPTEGAKVAENRTYTFRFLPQRPMQLSVILPSGAHAVLDPPFSSDVLNYTVVVPAEAPEVTVEMTPTVSFWASTDPAVLQGVETKRAGMTQKVALSAPPCRTDKVFERPTSYPGELPGADVDRTAAAELVAEGEAELAANSTSPDVANASVASFCPVEVMAFERKVDFPRVYRVNLLPAAPGTVVFLGMQGAEGLRTPLANFSPRNRNLQTVLPVEGDGAARLLVVPAEGATANWNGAPLAVTVEAGVAVVDLKSVRREVCACQRITGCGEKMPGPDVGESANGCELQVKSGAGEPYTLNIREGATALRLETAAAP